MNMKLPWMSRADRHRWKSATTIAELGQLMALWLEGEIASRPGYQPRYGPDEETTALIPTLAAANRAGYLTDASQPGCGEIGADGAWWEQKAAVSGLVADPDLVRRLVDVAERAGLDVVLHDILDTPHTGGIIVTTREGAPTTEFGSALGPRELAWIWRGCSRQAIDAIAGATQVTLTAPWFGASSLLWSALAEAIEPPPVCTVCGCRYNGFLGGVCGDGCSGVVDQTDGRCHGCIDPSVLIDWSKVRDDEPNECHLCGAPFYSAGRYCSDGCETADNPDDGEDAEAECVPARPAQPRDDSDEPPF